MENQFYNIIELQNEFNKEVPMKRNSRQIERRKRFIRWYIDKFPKIPTNEAIKNIADITFLSEKTIRNILFCNTNKKKSGNYRINQ